MDLTNWGWSGCVGSRRWSIFTGGESGLGAQGGCGVEGRKGPFVPSLVAEIREFGQDHMCLRLYGCHARSEGWLGEAAKSWMQNLILLLPEDWLPGELIAGGKVFVKFSGNIPEIQWGCCGVFFTLVKPILQLMFSLPSKLALLYVLRPPHVQSCCCCSIPVVSARKLFHEQQKQRPKFLETGAPGSDTKGISGACWWLSLNLTEALFARWIFFKNLQELEVWFISVPEGGKKKRKTSKNIFFFLWEWWRHAGCIHLTQFL